MGGHSYDDDDDDKELSGTKKKFFEFDCPSCNANNPWPDGFVDREEINCHYCGTSFQVKLSDEGKLKLREM